MKRIITIVALSLLIMVLMNGCTNQSKYPDGKDTVVFLGDGKFQIGRWPSSLQLVMYDDNNDSTFLDNNVIKYKRIKKNLYVIGNFYSIVNGETNTCKQNSITYKSETGEPENGSVITYIDSYDDFTDDEKKVFESMKE